MNDQADENQKTPEDQHVCFESEDGWGPLIADLEAKLNALSPGYSISQVKEKFGGLRY